MRNLLLLLLALCSGALDAREKKGNPAMPCYRALSDDARFATIKDKVILGPTTTSGEALRVARLAESPSDQEKPAIGAWRTAREDCHKLEKPYFATRDNDIQATAYRYFAALQALIRELEAGKLGYGEFGRRRVALFDKFNRDVEELQRGILPPKLPPPPGK